MPYREACISPPIAAFPRPGPFWTHPITLTVLTTVPGREVLAGTRSASSFHHTVALSSPADRSLGLTVAVLSINTKHNFSLSIFPPDYYRRPRENEVLRTNTELQPFGIPHVPINHQRAHGIRTGQLQCVRYYTFFEFAFKNFPRPWEDYMRNYQALSDPCSQLYIFLTADVTVTPNTGDVGKAELQTMLEDRGIGLVLQVAPGHISF